MYRITLDTTRDEPDKKRTDYRNDRALESSEQDEFKHTHYVEVLKDVLEQADTPLNIGLYGRWGVGKSSILRMLKEALSKHPLSDRFHYAEVDAWGFSAESLQQDILVGLNKELGTFPENEMKDALFNERVEGGRKVKQIFTKYWYVFLAAVAGIGIYGGISYAIFGTSTPSNLAGYVVIVGTLVTIIQLIVNSSKTTIPRPVSSSQFSEIYESMIRKQDKTLVVAIDNIDRCDAKVAVRLLGIIQTFMARRGCVNILACDNEAIIKHLSSVNGGKYTDQEGNEFLSKFFQVTIRIPLFIGENLDSYAQRLIEMRSIRFNPFVKQVLISGAVNSPRKINQFLNNITVLYRLAEHKEKDGRLQKDSVTGRTDILAKIVVLQHEWPEFYKELEKRPTLLNGKEDDWVKEQEIHNTGANTDGLRDFLNATKVCSTDDLSPFLRLNQESYQADIPEIKRFELDVNANNLRSVRETIVRLEEGKKEQYVKKINALADKHANGGAVLTAMNCTLIQMCILDIITDPAQRMILLANLGKHLSGTTVPYLEKYGYTKLFPIVLEIDDVYSNAIFRILANQGTENKIDAQLMNLFMDNNMSIPQEILDHVDEKMEKVFETDEEGVVSLLQDRWAAQEWRTNNFRKPTKTLLKFYKSISFDNSDKDNEMLALSGKIYNTISSEERAELHTTILAAARTAAESGSTLPPKLFETLDGIAEKIVEYFDMQEFVQALLQLASIVTDHEYKKQTFEVVFKIIKKIQVTKSSKMVSDMSDLLAEFLRATGHDELKWFMEKAAGHETKLMRAGKIVDAFCGNFYNNGPTDGEIINYLVTKVPTRHTSKIARLLSSLVSLEDEGRYSVLLECLVNDSDSWPRPMVIVLLNKFIKMSRSAILPTRVTILEKVVESCKKLDGRITLQQVAAEMLYMTSENDPAILTDVYRVIGKINDLDLLGTIGVDEAVDEADQRFELSDGTPQIHLDFIMSNVGSLSPRQKRNIQGVLRKKLRVDAPRDIQFLALDYAQRLDRNILRDLEYDITKLAENVQDDDIRMKCMEVLGRTPPN